MICLVLVLRQCIQRICIIILHIAFPFGIVINSMELCSIELGLSIYLKIQCLINKATLMNLKINGSIKSFDDTSMTIEELVIQLNLVGKRIAIEKNGMIISKSEFQNISLQDGDQLEIVGAVGGG